MEQPTPKSPTTTPPNTRPDNKPTGPSPSGDKPRTTDSSTSRSGRGVQGEGDYEAARRYRDEAGAFVKTHDTGKLAREAAPASPAEAQSLKDAEAQGRRHSRGEDPAVSKPAMPKPGSPDAA